MERIIKSAELEERLQVTRRTLDKWSERGLMPKKLTLVDGGRACGWAADEIEAWLEERLASREKEGAEK